MKLCLPCEPPAVGGGGFRFLRMWERWLTKQGIEWTRSLWDPRANVLFINGWQTHPWHVKVWKLMRSDRRVVHRVDGWGGFHNRIDQTRTDSWQKSVMKTADLVIFQSDWARQVSPPYAKNHTVIHNPVDLEMFSPDGPKAELPEWSGPRVAVVSWSTNPNKGAATIARLCRNHPKVQFILCGRFEIIVLPEHNNVHWAGVLSTQELAAHLRACDALVTFSQFEACPNHVLEAMACGLPVLYLDSGATRELVGECGFPVTEDSFSDFLCHCSGGWHVATKTYPRTIAEILFSPDLIFTRYLEAIRGAL